MDSILKLILFASILTNGYLYYYYVLNSDDGPQLGWSLAASAEAEAVAAISCSGHGRVFLDSVVVDGGAAACECNMCYVGDDCSLLSPDCPADADSGDPVYLEPYWQQHPTTSAVLLSGWHRMSYKTTGSDFISLSLSSQILRLHSLAANAVTDNKFLVFGTGSTQLINALLYALSNSTTNSPPSRVVASVPFYRLYQTQTELFDFREFQWGGGITNGSMQNRDGIIEFVTSPNNPNGVLMGPVIGGGSKVIYDHCYYWPHYTAIPAPADGDVMLFSNSKISGHASSRFGWALIKDRTVYEKTVNYISTNSMGVSRDTQLRILKILKAITAEMKGEQDIFKFGYATISKRWQRLNDLISKSDRFSLQKILPRYCTYFQKIRDPSPAYGWLKCEMEEDTDCAAILNDAGIITRGGAIFQADARYARLSLIKTQDDFELLMMKLEALIAKEKLNSV